MKYSEKGFRSVYHNFCLFPISEAVKAVAEQFPSFKDADSVLAYGYCDRTAGLTLEILCCAKEVDTDTFTFAKSPKDMRGIVRINAVAEEEFVFVGYDDDPIKDNFKHKLENLDRYDAGYEVEVSRAFEFIDEFRHEFYPDDVMVLTVKDGLKPEGCWVRITGLGDKYFIGTLLNEPDQNFGYHMGDTITFFLYGGDDDERALVSNMNEIM